MNLISSNTIVKAKLITFLKCYRTVKKLTQISMHNYNQNLNYCIHQRHKIIFQSINTLMTEYLFALTRLFLYQIISKKIYLLILQHFMKILKKF